MAGKSHLDHGGQQSAIRTVVIGQQQIGFATGAQRGSELHQRLRVIEVGWRIT